MEDRFLKSDIEEKRSLARLPCRLDVFSGAARIGFVNDVCLNGFRISSPLTLDPKKTYSFGVKFPDKNKTEVFEGKIVYSVPNLGEDTVFHGFHIQSETRRAKKELENFILARRLATQTDELLESFKKLKNNHTISPLKEKTSIEGLMKLAHQTHASFRIIVGELFEPLEGRLVKINGGRLAFKLKKNRSLGEMKECTVLALIHYQSYFFETTIEDISSEGLTLSVPKEIYYSEKRGSPRTLASESSKYIKVDIRIPGVEELSLPIIDYSDGGAALQVSGDQMFFLPGTPLNDLDVPFGAKRKRAALVKYACLTSSSPEIFKVGIQFSDGVGSSQINYVPSQKYTSQKPWLYNFLEKAKSLGGYFVHTQSEKLGIKHREKVNVVYFKNSHGHELAGILDSTLDLTKKSKSPVVIILPAWVKRKESFAPLALTVVDNFKRNYQDVTVLRFDITNHIGESYKNDGCREQGKECLSHTASGILADVEAALNFVKKNQYFSPTEIIFLSFSYLSPFARHIIHKDQGKNIKYWVSAMGAPDVQSIVRTVGGGIDYISNYRQGIKSGVVSFFGALVDMDDYCKDVLTLGMDSLDMAKSEMGQIGIPICSIYGKYDAWVDEVKVKEIMTVPSSGSRELIELESGHLPVSSDEAFSNFELISQKIFEHLHGRPIATRRPPTALLLRKTKAERKRLVSDHIEDINKYWETYLMGEGDRSLGYDILSLSPDYNLFLEQQAKLLNLSPKDHFLDLGSGTGPFEAMLFQGASEKGWLPQKIVQVDLVQEALNRAQQKQESHLKKYPGCQAFYQATNLVVSRYAPVKHFLDGEYPNILSLNGKIEGLEEEILEEWNSNYSFWLHAYLRGQISTEDLYRAATQNVKSQEAILALKDFHTAARIVRGLQEPRSVAFAKLVFNNEMTMDLPFKSSSFDKILCSLILSYLFNPEETIRETYRILKPDGIVVASTMRPDADFSLIYKNLVSSIENQASSSEEKEKLLNNARSFMNAAALLWRHQSEGLFSFFTENEFIEMFHRAGFSDIRLEKGYGNPSQALVLYAKKGPHGETSTL